MPQNKSMKKAAPRFSQKKQTNARLYKVNLRKAHKEGLLMKKKNKTEADKLKAKLTASITKNIEDEMCSRVAASAVGNLKILKPPSDEKNSKSSS